MNHSTLARSAVQTIAGKAIRDLKDGGKRETRNVIEFCKGFAGCRPSQNFWDMVKNFTFFSGSHYDPLLHRVASCVREDSLKTLAVNLGYTAFGEGAERIRSYSQTGQEAMWIQHLPPEFREQEEIDRWNAQGVFVFVMEIGNNAQSLKKVLSMADHNLRCTFVLIAAKAPTPDWVSQIAHCNNICILATPTILQKYAAQMEESGVLFGVFRNYSDIKSVQAEKKKIERWIALGCALDVCYMPTNLSSTDQSEDYYQRLVKVRTKGSVELFLCDIQRDSAIVQDMILHKRALPDISVKTK